MNKWLMIAAAIALVVVGSVAGWQLSGDDARSAGALEASDEPITLSWRGVWSEKKAYGLGQVVRFKGATWVAERETLESEPDPWCEDDCRNAPPAWCEDDCRWALVAN